MSMYTHVNTAKIGTNKFIAFHWKHFTSLKDYLIVRGQREMNRESDEQVYLSLKTFSAISRAALFTSSGTASFSAWEIW